MATLFRQAYFDENDIVKKWFEETYSPIDATNADVDFRKLVKFSVKDMFTDSNIKGRSFDQFRKELAKVAGTRCVNNRRNSRGVYKNGNNFMLQGYQYMSQDTAEEAAANGAQTMRFH
jgi:hypothetical protein